MIPKFSHLSYFVAIAEEGSFHAAAERLHISQPSLSRQIRDVETHLEVELLVRSKTGVTLTPAGEALLERARCLLKAREQLLEACQNQQPQPDSQSRPSAPITIG